jgi:hypothetical protein
MTPDGQVMMAPAEEPEAATEEPEATTEEPAEIETRPTPKQQLIAAAKRAALALGEHGIWPEVRDELIAAIELVENGSRRARAATAEPRGQTKQEAMIEMLKRDEGATIAEMAVAMGWQAHTVRGAMAGALRKKLGLNVVTSGKVEGRGRVYHIEPQQAE